MAAPLDPNRSTAVSCCDFTCPGTRPMPRPIEFETNDMDLEIKLPVPVARSCSLNESTCSNTSYRTEQHRMPRAMLVAGHCVIVHWA
jgi:hypothetical protein